MKKNTKKTGKNNKLGLKKDTVRKLTNLPAEDLAEVAGGLHPLSRPTCMGCEDVV